MYRKCICIMVFLCLLALGSYAFGCPFRRIGDAEIALGTVPGRLA